MKSIEEYKVLIALHEFAAGFKFRRVSIPFGKDHVPAGDDSFGLINILSASMYKISSARMEPWLS